MVLATIHTNDAASTLTRLTEMGVEPFLSASGVLGRAWRSASPGACAWSAAAR